jgi:hypothetical protein
MFPEHRRRVVDVDILAEQESWYRQQIGAAGLGLVAGFIVVVPAVLFLSGWLIPVPHQKEGLAERISALTTILNVSAKAVADIESEIAQRRDLVRQLQSDAERAKQLSAVSREQAEAVAQALKIELERREQSSFWSNVLMNLAFVFIGIVATEVFHWGRGKYLKKAFKREPKEAAPHGAS